MEKISGISLRQAGVVLVIGLVVLFVFSLFRLGGDFPARPVIFIPTSTPSFTPPRTVTIFFGRRDAPRGAECTAAYPVERTIATDADILRAAIEELLKGPSPSELQSGYYTSINPSVSLRSVAVSDGSAYVDFDKTLEEQVGGSCRMTAIRTQIVMTLMQFEGVEEVVISIDGRTEDILQP